jgi:beta-galactosidase
MEPESNKDLRISLPGKRLLGPDFPFGAEYNPEQWTAAMGYPDESIWQEDLRLMRQARINLVTLGVFGWASIQPDEETYSMEWLDRILDLLAEADIGVCLATGTAAQPAWASAAYPDILPVTGGGVRKRHGQRMNYCPTSPTFRRLANSLVTRLAERYHEHPALRLWHVSNEYGPECFCDRCAARFRLWLQARYGSLAALNTHWVTPFWSHTYTSWEQILPPSSLGEHRMLALLLDYQRFLSDMNLAGYQEEAKILHELTPNIPITTNFHGLIKSLDYASWSPHLDLISWDSYPPHGEHPSRRAFRFDVMRGLKGGQSWLLMEQTPGQVEWRPQNPMKRPHEMRLQSYQALAHGSDGIMFFQWRQSRGSTEMFHSAIVGHSGHEDTRIFHEVATLGQELRRLDRAMIGTPVPARIALILSWPNWWAVEADVNPSHTLNYLETVQRYYQAFWDRQIPVDVISPDTPLERYALVIAPLWMMVSEQQGKAVERYVEGGGTFLASYFSGVIDEDGRAWLGGYPGPLRRSLGLWIEEVDPFTADMANTVVTGDTAQLPFRDASCSAWAEVVRLEGASPIATFATDYYAGHPAITRHHLGRGKSYYIATELEEAMLGRFLGYLAEEAGTAPSLVTVPGVEVTVRQGRESTYFFLLNHLTVSQRVVLPTPMQDIIKNERWENHIDLPPGDVAILVPECHE